MVGKCRHALSRGEVPKLYGAVVAARDDLGIGPLRQYRPDGVVVAGKAVDLVLRPHVPDASDGIASAGDEEVERGVELEGKYARQVAVIVPDDLIRLQIPALYFDDKGER